MSVDPRSRKVAVVADSLLGEKMDELREAGWGVIQLPPVGLDPGVAKEWIDLAAEQVAEYLRTEYEVVLVDDGRWRTAIDAALAALGAPPLRDYG
jgi:hypothetical protein